MSRAPIIIASSDLRPGCRDLALLRRMDPAVQMPNKLAIRKGSLRHDIRRECWRRKMWPPTVEQLTTICKDTWLPAYKDLMEDDFREVREQMLAALRVPDLWPPVSSVLAMEDWMPGVATVTHRDRPGWDVLIGFLADGTEVHLRSRFDLVSIDESNVAVGVITDTKGASGDYTYQAEHNALGASMLWDGIPTWRYQAVYLSSDRRPQVLEFDAPALERVRRKLMGEAVQIAAELEYRSADATPGDDCDWCPKRKGCPAVNAALTPMGARSVQEWPTPAELPTLPTPELLDVYLRFEPGKGLVDDYAKALRGELTARMEAEKTKRLVDGTGAGVQLNDKSGGNDATSIEALVDFCRKHGLKLDDCLSPKWGEITKALRKYTAQKDIEDATAELVKLQTPKARVKELRSIKQREEVPA